MFWDSTKLRRDNCFAPANPWLWMTCLPMWFWRDNNNSGALTKKRLQKQCQVHVTQMIHLECSFITIRCEGEGQTKHTSIQHQHVQFPAHLKHINPLNPKLNPICYLLALLGAHHFLHVSRIRVKSLTFRRLMSYIYGAPILDVSRSHTTTQHSR